MDDDFVSGDVKIKRAAEDWRDNNEYDFLLSRLLRSQCTSDLNHYSSYQAYI